MDSIPHTDGPFQALTQAFVMIVVSEIGDKTFLIAAIMATRHPRLTVFSGAFCSLLIMSVLSAAMGKVVLGLVPVRWTHFFASLLFLVFGIRMLFEGFAIPSGSAHMQEEMREVEDEIDEEEDRDLHSAENGEGEGKMPVGSKVLFDAEEGRGGGGMFGGENEDGGEKIGLGSKGDVLGESTGRASLGGETDPSITMFGNSTSGSGSGTGSVATAKRKAPSISPGRHAMAFNAKASSSSHPLSAPPPSSSNPFSTSTSSSSSPTSRSYSSRTPFTSFLLSLRHRLSLSLSGSPISLSSTFNTKSIKQSTKNLMGLFFSPVFVQAFVLTFLGEWGDRSQIATIALGGANSVSVVAFGTIIGHGLCTALAVIGGRLLSTKISIRHITLIGATAFLIFAILYAYEGFTDEA